MRTSLGLLRLFFLAAVVILSGCRGGVSVSPILPIVPVTFSTQTPIVVATNPSYYVAPDRFMYLKFSHDMDPATLNPSTVYIDGVTSTVSYDAPNRMVYVKPTTNLKGEYAYTLTVTTGVRDTTGVAMPAPYAFMFFTRAALDESRPTAVPIPGCVPPAGPVAVQFNQNMNSATINASTFLVFDSNSDPVTGTVSYDAATRIGFFTPSTPFVEGATYTGTLTSDIQDLGGNSLIELVWNFTVCTTPPATEFCSFSKGAYQGGGTAGQFFNANFSTVFSSDLIIGVFDGSGSQASIRWTAVDPGPANLKAFLTSPAGGPSMALVGDQVNPTQSTAGQLPEQVAALTLNVGFSGTGFFPAGFGNLVLTNTGTSLDGSTILDILAVANLALAGNGLPAGYSFGALNDLITNLNESWDNCEENEWAAEHLVVP